MDWKIALHMCGWGAKPLPDLLTAASELGYDGVELAIGGLEKEYGLDKVDKMLREYGVQSAPTVYAGAGNYRDPNILPAEIERVREFCCWIKEHGGRGVMFSPVIGANGPRTAEEERNIYHVFQAVGEAIVSERCVPLYHNHYVYSHELSRQIFKDDLENLDWNVWKLCLDTGHTILCLEDPVEIFDRWSEHIGWIHLKDVMKTQFEDTAAPTPFRELHKFFTPLGQGVVDFPGVLDVLHKAGYDGWLAVEQDYSHTTPYEAARDSIGYLKTKLAE